MKLSISEIREICRDIIIQDTISSNEVIYEWIDIVGIPQRPDFKNGENVLYCASYSHKDGWTDGFDRRPYSTEVCLKNSWHLVTELIPNNEHCQYLLVKSVDSFALSLFEHASKKASPIIIGVTGSVGKTTTVSFIEDLLSYNKKKVVRFYSKRLTPTSVFCHYINRVDLTTEYIVMEYSAYHSDHVSVLSKILSPETVFFLNVYETHINPGMFKNKEEIIESKLKIRTGNTKFAFIHDSLLGYKHSYPGWNFFSTKFPKNKPKYLPPTNRTFDTFTVGKIIESIYSLAPGSAEIVLRSFKAKEDRINLFYVSGKKIFFHGETSGGSRLISWFEVEDENYPNFFIDEIDFADEDPEGFKNLIEIVVSSSKTFVLDSDKNRYLLKDFSVNFFSQDVFFRKLANSSGYIVFHKALSTRDKNFDPLFYLKKVLSTF